MESSLQVASMVIAALTLLSVWLIYNWNARAQKRLDFASARRVLARAQNRYREREGVPSKLEYAENRGTRSIPTPAVDASVTRRLQAYNDIHKKLLENVASTKEKLDMYGEKVPVSSLTEGDFDIWAYRLATGKGDPRQANEL